MSLFPLSEMVTTLVDGISKALRIRGEVSVIGMLDNSVAAPSTGLKTVTATTAEIFAGASAKSGRRRLIIKNEDRSLRFRIGESSINQQNGFPVEPGAIVKMNFDPSIALPIFGVSEGASLQVTVWEE